MVRGQVVIAATYVRSTPACTAALQKLIKWTRRAVNNSGAFICDVRDTGDHCMSDLGSGLGPQATLPLRHGQQWPYAMAAVNYVGLTRRLPIEHGS